MVGGTIASSKMDNLNEKASEDVEVSFKNIANVQKSLIDQQKELIDWLTGQVRKVSEEKPRGFKDHLKERPTQFWIAGVFLAIISISSLILFFCLYNFSVPNPVPPTFGHDDNLGDGIQVIRREEWLARGPLNTTTFRKRPKIVRILHSTGPNCSDYQTCANKVLGLQSMHVGEDGLPDIAYNFLIGGDGNVYIGRGAEVQPEGRSDSIDIAYVGNYLAPYDRVSDKMDEAGRNLITRLLERKKILKDYIVVAQNQTEKTLSPGENGWNAKPPLKVTKFKGPVKMVRIMHTGGSNCQDLQICSQKVNILQGWQIGTKGMPDLQYNYMIGGDGNVYVVRGPENQGEIRSDSIDICYLGNFLTPYDKMTDKMEQAGKRLIGKLEKDGFITPDYIVVAQNQTVFTQSPGQNIYKKIVNWPHYDSGIYF